MKLQIFERPPGAPVQSEELHLRLIIRPAGSKGMVSGQLEEGIIIDLTPGDILEVCGGRQSVLWLAEWLRINAPEHDGWISMTGLPAKVRVPKGGEAQ